jgi:CarboxypepD_reg-like domain
VQKRRLFWMGLVAMLCLAGVAGAQGQKPKNTPGNKTSQGQTIIQFSGLVVAGEKAYGVPGASVQVPRTKRGTATNLLGYFSIPVLEGDTAHITAVGFRKRLYVIPGAENASHSVIIYMEADTFQLPTVDVVPFPTEALFKEAFLALNRENRDVLNARKNLDPYAVEQAAQEMPMDGKMNYTQAMNSRIRGIETAKTQATFSFLDPFAWGRFIESVKRGDLKRKDKKDEEE